MARPEDKALAAALDAAIARTHAALCDNFDTPAALAALGTTPSPALPLPRSL